MQLQKGVICNVGKSWLVLVERFVSNDGGITIGGSEKWWCCWLDGTHLTQANFLDEQIIGYVQQGYNYPEIPKPDPSYLAKAILSVRVCAMDETKRHTRYENIVRVVNAMVDEKLKELKK